jgi:hypothetical protein
MLRCIATFGTAVTSTSRATSQSVLSDVHTSQPSQSSGRAWNSQEVPKSATHTLINGNRSRPANPGRDRSAEGARRCARARQKVPPTESPKRGGRNMGGPFLPEVPKSHRDGDQGYPGSQRAWAGFSLQEAATSLPKALAGSARQSLVRYSLAPLSDCSHKVVKRMPCDCAGYLQAIGDRDEQPHERDSPDGRRHDETNGRS